MPGLFAVMAAMTAAQVMLTFVNQSPGLFAPVVAPALGFAPQTVGVYIGTVAISALGWGLLAPRLAARLGPLATIEIAFCAMAGGLLLSSWGWLSAVLAGAVAIGVGAGLIVPASSQIVARVTPVHRLSLMFSIKQAGFPAGLALAGLLIPLSLLHLGWESSMQVLALVLLATAAALEPLRTRLDRDARSALGAASSSVPLFPVRLMLASRAMHELAFLGTSLSAAQVVFIGFTVSYLNIELHFSLLGAGTAFGLSQLTTVIGRVLFGWLADVIGDPLRVLVGLILGAGVCSFFVSALTPAWPAASVFTVLVLFSVFAVGWAGVFLAAVARYAPKGSVGGSTAVMQFFIQLGAIIGPLVMAAAVSVLGSYGAAYAALGALFGGSGLFALLARRRALARDVRELRKSVRRRPRST